MADQATFVNGIEIVDTSPARINDNASLYTYGGIAIYYTAEAVSETDGGSLLTLGGMTVVKNSLLYGNVRILDTTDSVNLTTGALRVDGGASFTKNVYGTFANFVDMDLTNITVPNILTTNITTQNIISTTSTLSSVVSNFISTGTLNATGITVSSIQSTDINTTTLSSTTSTLPNTVSTNISSSTVNTTGLTSQNVLVAGLISSSNITSTTSTLPNTISTNISSSTVNTIGLTSQNVLVTGLISSSNISSTTSTLPNVVSTNISSSTLNTVGLTSQNVLVTGLISSSNMRSTTSTLPNMISTNISTSTINTTGITTSNFLATGLISSTNIISTTSTLPNMISTNISTSTINTIGLTVGNILATNTSTTTLNSTTSTLPNTVSTNISSVTANITGLTGTNVLLTNMNTVTATVPNMVSTNISVSNISVGTLNSVTSNFTNVNATNISSSNINLVDGMTTSNILSTGVISSNLLTNTSSTITNLSTLIGSIASLSSTNITTTNLVGTLITTSNLRVTNSTQQNILMTNISGSTANITGITTTNLLVTGLISSSNITSVNNTLSSVVSTNISSVTANITGITSTNLLQTNATITNMVNTNGSIGTLNVTNVVSSNITTGSIRASGLISAGQISGVTGTIPNLMSVNITTGTMNVLTGLTTVNILATGLISSTNLTGVNNTLQNTLMTNISGTNMNISNMVAVNITSSNVFAGYISAGNASFNEITSGNHLIKSLSGASKITLDVKNTQSPFAEIEMINSTTGDYKIHGSLGEVQIQSGGGRAFQIGSYHEIRLNGARLTTTPLSYVNGGFATRNVIVQNSNDSIGLSIIGNSTQTNDLLRVTNSSGSTIYTKMDNIGNIVLNNTNNATDYTVGGTIISLGGVSIAKSIFVGNNINVKQYIDQGVLALPANPNTNYIRYFTDTSDSLYKSLDSSGTLTTYQPTNTKGDLLTHNGTTQIRLPVSTNGFILAADSTQSSGLVWRTPKKMYDAIVDINGDGDYTSIKAAFDAGNKTVYIKKGTYVETGNITIPSGCRINTEGKGVVCDFSGGNFSFNIDGTGRFINTGVISISSGSTITGSGTTFTTLLSGDYIEINNTFHKILTVTNNTSIILENVYRGKVISGVAFRGSSFKTDISINDLEIRNSINYGIYIRQCYRITLRNVILTKCGTTSTNAALHAEISTESVYTDVIIANSNYIGMNLLNNTKDELTNCIFKNNTSTGLTINSCNGELIGNCLYTQNGSDGLTITGTSTRVNITEGLSDGNSGKGVKGVSGTDSIVIDGMIVQNNTGDGIYYDSTNSSMTGCITSNNGGIGIQAAIGSIIKGCRVINNTGVGIQASTDNNCVISGNYVKGNGSTGIVLGADSICNDNYVDSNISTGILVTTNSSTIIGNRAIGHNIGINISGNLNGVRNNILENNTTKYTNTGTGTNSVNQISEALDTYISPTFYAIIKDVKSQGTNGGTFTNGAWRQRDLNTIINAASSRISLGTNEFTLQAGSYLIDAKAMASEVDSHKLRINNTTDNTQVYGMSSDIGGTNSTIAFVYTNITITSAKVFRVEHRCQTSRTTIGYGRPSGFGEEVYCTVIITVIA